MEAGKKRLRRNSPGEANRAEVERCEHQRLARLSADLSLTNMPLKKSRCCGAGTEAVRAHEAGAETGSARTGAGSPVEKKQTLGERTCSFNLLSLAAALPGQKRIPSWGLHSASRKLLASFRWEGHAAIVAWPSAEECAKYNYEIWRASAGELLFTRSRMPLPARIFRLGFVDVRVISPSGEVRPACSIATSE
jgi:hypothetical protein